MAVHKVGKTRTRKARKARRNGARARTSVSNGAHSKRRRGKARKARRNGYAAAARKPRGKRVFRRNGSGRKVVSRRRNGVSGSALTNTGKPVEMILTVGAGALGAVAVGAIAEGLLSKNEWLNKAENDNVKAAIPGAASIAVGLALAKFTKNKMGRTAGVAMAVAGTVILVKDVAGAKIKGYVSKAMPGDTKGAWMNGLSTDFMPQPMLPSPRGNVAGAWMGAQAADYTGETLF
jgi:hypothetical protein